jgi:hypothetical protein
MVRASLHDKRPDAGIRLVAVPQQLDQPRRRPPDLAQPGRQAGNPGRRAEGDPASFQVQGPGRGSLDLQDARRPLKPQILKRREDMSLGSLGGGKYLDLDVAAAGNTEVIRAKMRTMDSLRLDDSIEDILITLAKQYHLIRLLKSSRSEQGLFLYLVLDRGKSNLALARHNLRQIESELAV